MKKNSTKKSLTLGLTAILVFIAAFIAILITKSRDTDQTQYDTIILDASRRHNLPPELIKAVIRKESSFRYQARGNANEFGLMQFRLPVVQDWCRVNHKTNFSSPSILLNPEINIEIGSWFLAKAIKDWRHYKDWKILALAQYNAGRKNALRWAPQDPEDEAFQNISFPMTKTYISDILHYEEFYNKQFRQKRQASKD